MKINHNYYLFLKLPNSTFRLSEDICQKIQLTKSNTRRNKKSECPTYSKELIFVIKNLKEHFILTGLDGLLAEFDAKPLKKKITSNSQNSFRI